MCWSEKLYEYQAELYTYIINYLYRNGGNTDHIRFDKEKKELYFLVDGDWVSKNDVDIFDVAEIADMYT